MLREQISDLLPVPHPVITDVDALLLLRANPAVVGNPHNVTVVRVMGILLRCAPLKGSIRQDQMACQSELGIRLVTLPKTAGKLKTKLPLSPL